MSVRALPAERARSMRLEIREGLAYVRARAVAVGDAVSASLSLLFFLGPIEVLLPFVVRNELGAGAGGFGRRARRDRHRRGGGRRWS